MKRLLLFLLVLETFTISGAYSQEKDNNGTSYRRIKHLSDSTYIIQEFDSDSVLLFIGTLSSLEPRIRNGRFRFYNNEGKVDVSGFYYDDVPYGKWVYFDKEGKITRVLDYKAVWDFMFENQDGNNAFQGFQAGDGGDGQGDKQESGCQSTGPEPTFKGRAPYYITEYIKDNAVYPVYAQDMGIKDSTVIRFTVDSGGKISRATILSGNSPDLNLEAMRVLLESKGWNTGLNKEESSDFECTIKVKL